MTRVFNFRISGRNRSWLHAMISHAGRCGIFVLSLLIQLTPIPAIASDVERVGDDVYLFGREAIFESNTLGDAVVTGGRVLLRGSIGGDAMVAGGEVNIQSVVGGSLFAAAGDVGIEGYIRKNARAAGESVTLAHAGQVEGALTVIARRITVAGYVGGYALLNGNHVHVDGTVRGDLRVKGGNLTLGPNALIHGRLVYDGGTPPSIDPSARVLGGITVPEERPDDASPGVAHWVLLIGLIVVTSLFLILAPNAVRYVTRSLRTRPGWSFVIGLVALVGVPMVILALAITVVGIPLSVLLIFSYAVLLILGYLVFAASLADLTLERPAAAPVWQRIILTALALVVLFGLALIPYVGWLVWIVAVTFGVGAIVPSTVSALSWNRARR